MMHVRSSLSYHKVPGRQGCRSGQLPYMTTPRGVQPGSTPSLSDADSRWTARELAAEVGVPMSQKCAPHSARQSELEIPRIFVGTTMASLCSRTGLVGQVPKGR